MFACSDFEGGTSRAMQDDFDKFRIGDINYLFSMAQEYKDTAGYYPFEKESNEVPVVVVFESDMQKSYHKGRYPIMVDLESRGKPASPTKINTIGYDQFYKEIESKLKKKIDKRFDPQKVPTKKPCLYVYVVYKKTIDISTFLHNDLSFTRNLSEFNNKFALTSSSDSFLEFGLWNLKDVERISEYNNFINEPLNR